MDSSEIEIIIRPAELTDKSFIMATWLKGNYYGNSYFNQIPPDTYYKVYASHLESILCNPSVTIDVACDKENPSWLIGFVVCDGQRLHWAYVKHDYRSKGIATLLTKNRMITSVTHSTKCGQAITRKKKLIFNPL